MADADCTTGELRSTYTKRRGSIGTRNADPEVQVLQEETIHEVQKLVQQLPEKYRLVVYLYYSADMKLTEIAECLHLSVNTVKTRLRKAKSLLKEKLEVIGYER